MELPADVLILVADGEKALFLRNTGDEVFPDLVVVEKDCQVNPRSGEQGTNRRGRVFKEGQRRAAVADTDWHRLAKDRFAADMADMLYKRAHAQDFSKLILAAPPHILGDLRSRMHKEVTDKVIAEIDKDFTNHPIDKLERQLREFH